MAEVARRTQSERYAIQQYRKGRLPAQVIPEIVEKYGYTESTAFDRAYVAWKRFKESLAHISDNAAEYCLGTLQKIVEDSMECEDRKNALKAIDQIAKILKLTEGERKVDVNVNFGFDFDGENKDGDENN